MTVNQLQLLAPGRGEDELYAFTQRVFSSLRRVDQRRWADVYLRGLLLGEGRKSIRRTADEALYGPAVQSLQQFVNQSPWDWAPVRAQLAAETMRHTGAEAWTLEYAITPKRGDRSAGVERRFIPGDGRMVNCQVGIGVFLTSRCTSVPVNWRLLLSPRWCGEPAWRRRARIPDSVTARSEPAEILDLLDEMCQDWRLPQRPLLAEWRRSTTAGELLRGLAARRRPFVVEVDGTLPVLGPRLHAVAATSPAVPWTSGPMTVREYVHSREVRRHVAAWRAPAGALTSMPVTLPASRSARRHRRDPDHGPLRVIGVRYGEERRSDRYWITNLADWPVERVASLLRLREPSRRAIDRLGSRFGLRSFEGRSFPGWHHHMTMVSAAGAYASLFGDDDPPVAG